MHQCPDESVGTHCSVAAAQLKELRVPDAQAGVHRHEEAGKVALREEGPALSVLLFHVQDTGRAEPDSP